MRGLLVRVGIDQTPEYGGWNAPVSAQTRRFIFVPIRDSTYNDAGYIANGERVYCKEVTAELARFGAECGDPVHSCFRLPPRLRDEPMHVDPDFLNLTYGDDPRRGRRLKEFKEDDFIAFYSSLRSLQGGTLVYALIGLFVLAGSPIRASEIADPQRLCNAHTRWKNVKGGDIVAFGKTGQSGLFERCIPIGELREGAYRVCKNVLTEWGDLTVKNGWLQRSANLPEFKAPASFRKWLDKQDIRLDRAQYQVPMCAAE